MTPVRARFIGSLAALGLMAACGGGSPSSPSTVAVIVRDGGTGGASGATVTITGAGVAPGAVTVAAGQTVTFINNDNRSHEIASNPHPRHGSCPSIEAGLGTIAAGQTRVTHAFASAGTCGYHDHLDDTNGALKGTIVVQ
jgi:plastocyanin